METPIVQLLRRATGTSGLTRVQIVRALGYTNLAKGCRRLDRHLGGSAREPEFLERLAQVLAIPTPQIEVALEACEDQERRRAEELREAERRADFVRKGPHLWVILPKGYLPSLISVIGPERFLLVPIPAEIVARPDFEQFQEVGAIARAHFNDPNRSVRQVAGYWFRRSLDETFAFSTEGDFVGTREGPAPPGVVRTHFRGGFRKLRRILGAPGS